MDHSTNRVMLSVNFCKEYAANLQAILASQDWSGVEKLCLDLVLARKRGAQIFLCGNGGSAANSMHIANDLLYGVAGADGKGLRVQALAANQAMITCLANDVGYESIFAQQLNTLARPDDILIVFSGSGNSPNIVRALERAREMKLHTYAILGYSGGKARDMADTAIHFPVDDMQIAEDCQLIVGHMLMRRLSLESGS